MSAELLDGNLVGFPGVFGHPIEWLAMKKSSWERRSFAASPNCIAQCENAIGNAARGYAQSMSPDCIAHQRKVDRYMEVRILTEADAEAFWNIRLRALRDNPESFGASYEEILARGIEGTAQGLRQSDAHTDDATFGAFDDNTLIGIAGFRREKEVKRHHKAVIWGMYVPAEVRQRGIGKALLEAAIAYAKTLPDLEKINLSVVLTSKEARRLFISLGFETYGLERRALKLHDQYFDQEHMTLWLR